MDACAEVADDDDDKDADGTAIDAEEEDSTAVREDAEDEDSTAVAEAEACLLYTSPSPRDS